VPRPLARPILGEKLADDLAPRRGFGLFVFRHEHECFLAAQLPGDFTPRCFAKGFTLLTAATFDRIKLGADEDRRGGLRHFPDTGSDQQLRHASPFLRRRAVMGEVV
jgi:hypothetical protein